jgi:long-subunit acyl-CoA synthetase (AMP-forming)
MTRPFFVTLSQEEPEPWTPDDCRELLTPTFKKKRPQLLKMYQAQIDDMYKQINRAGDAR